MIICLFYNLKVPELELLRHLYNNRYRVLFGYKYINTLVSNRLVIVVSLHIHALIRCHMMYCYLFVSAMILELQSLTVTFVLGNMLHQACLSNIQEHDTYFFCL